MTFRDDSKDDLSKLSIQITCIFLYHYLKN